MSGWKYFLAIAILFILYVIFIISIPNSVIVIVSLWLAFPHNISSINLAYSANAGSSGRGSFLGLPGPVSGAPKYIAILGGGESLDSN
jgi:hypothetical protein